MSRKEIMYCLFVMICIGGGGYVSGQIMHVVIASLIGAYFVGVGFILWNFRVLLLPSHLTPVSEQVLAPCKTLGCRYRVAPEDYDNYYRGYCLTCFHELKDQGML